MGQFLRDQLLSNIAIDEPTLDRLNAFFVAQLNAKNAGQIQPHQRVVHFYVIRFDEKGYRFVDFNDVKRYYGEAQYVERVIFTMDSGENRQSQGLFGTNVEMRLDAKDVNSCRLSITADDQAWVDATFTGLSDILARQRSLSRFIRTQWTALVIQLGGVVVGFLISLWAAVKIASNLKIDNAFAISFIFALLIFSNLWGYATNQLARLIDLGFPNIRFKRKDKDGPHWFIKALVGGLAVAACVYLLNLLFGVIGQILSGFVTK